MSNSSSTLRADVLIVGAGPVGLTLANLLGTYGVRTVIIERHDATVHEPRAVSIDDESLRTMQAAGLVDDVVKDVVMGYGVRYFSWRGNPFAAIQPTRQEYGYPKRNAFRQPLLEATLAQGTRRFGHVSLLFRHELLSFEQSATGVTAQVRHDGGELTIEAPWMVACDGGRSPVREMLGIPLEGETYPERWLIVDLAQRTVPLRHTSTFCDPRRPAIRLPGPHGTLRYEFMLRPGDRDEEVLDEKNFRAWIANREPQDAELPLVRKVIYTFHARVAQRWREGRVFLAGDAAHLTPPFAGQGLNSGIRDATNLSWKLAAVVRGQAPESILDTYESERRPHASALIRMALRIGHFMQPKSVFGAAVSQAALRVACLLPPVRDYILQLKFKPKPVLERGWYQPSPVAPKAELLTQPRVELPDGRHVLMDTVLGGDYAVLGWDSPAFRAAAARLLPPGAPGRVVGVLRQELDFIGTLPQDMALVRDVTGELAQWLDARGAVAVVIRPDRYWYALVAPQALGASQAQSLPLPVQARAA